MLRWGLIFLVVALVAGAFGMWGVEGMALSIAADSVLRFPRAVHRVAGDGPSGENLRAGGGLDFESDLRSAGLISTKARPDPSVCGDTIRSRAGRRRPGRRAKYPRVFAWPGFRRSGRGGDLEALEEALQLLWGHRLAAGHAGQTLQQRDVKRRVFKLQFLLVDEKSRLSRAQRFVAALSSDDNRVVARGVGFIKVADELFALAAEADRAAGGIGQDEFGREGGIGDRNALFAERRRREFSIQRQADSGAGSSGPTRCRSVGLFWPARARSGARIACAGLHSPAWPNARWSRRQRRSRARRSPGPPGGGCGAGRHFRPARWRAARDRESDWPLPAAAVSPRRIVLLAGGEEHHRRLFARGGGPHLEGAGKMQIAGDWLAKILAFQIGHLDRQDVGQHGFLIAAGSEAVQAAEHGQAGALSTVRVSSASSCGSKATESRSPMT